MRTGIKVPYVYLREQFNPEGSTATAILKDIRNELYNCQFTLGGWVDRFEEAVCEKYGCGYCVGVGSGTDALELSILASERMGILNKLERIYTAPNSFVATAGAILATGHRLRFADVGPDYLLDPAAAVGAYYSFHSFIPVHLTGLARPFPGLVTVYDAAQAIGAKYDGVSVTRMGEFNAFSMHPLKNLNIWGDGGFITTDNPEAYTMLRTLRNHGLVDRDTVEIPGRNSRLDTIQAIVAWHVLQTVDEENTRRIDNARIYDTMLSDIPEVVIPPRDPLAYQVYHTYVIQVERREELREYLTSMGVETKVHYPIPIHQQPGYRDYSFSRLPATENQSTRILTLPIHPFLEVQQIEYAAEVIRNFYGGVYAGS